MATGSDIQVENGNFSRIHNEILDQLAQYNLSGREFRCLLFLLRKTYGHQKKEDAISYSQWEKGTQIKRAHVAETLDGLVAKRIVLRTGGGVGRGNVIIWGFNKYYEQWSTGEKIVPPYTEGLLPPGVTNIQGNDREIVPPGVTGNSTPRGNGIVTPGGTHKRKKKIKDTAMQPAMQDTPQQGLFGAVCDAIGWDYRTLSKKDRGQVAQTCGILSKATYTIDDVQKFMVDIWFHDWRWQKNQQRPTLTQLRQEIGKLRIETPDTIPRNGRPYDRNEDVGGISWHNMIERSQRGQNHVE
jgi:phage replication O-like protein O